MPERNLVSENRGFPLFLIFFGVIYAISGLVYILPSWKLMVYRPYIVDERQMAFAGETAFKFGTESIIIGGLLLGIGYLMRKYEDFRKLPRLIINLLFFLIFNISCFFLIENILIVALPKGQHLFVYDAETYWDFKKGAKGRYFNTWIEINEQGFRGAMIETIKPSNEIRYGFLGNSIVFGYCLQEYETLPYLMEKAFASVQDSFKYRMVNLGVPGFYVEQELKKFKRYNDFGFNKVIFAFCINDLIAKHELREIANYENIIFPNAKLSQKS
jgi:hypothetical protein